MTAKQMAGVISEKTRLPISLILTLAGLLVSIVAWAATLEARVGGHVDLDEKRDVVLTAKMEQTWEAYHSIDKRLGEQAIQLDRIEEQLKSERR